MRGLSHLLTCYVAWQIFEIKWLVIILVYYSGMGKIFSERSFLGYRGIGGAKSSRPRPGQSLPPSSSLLLLLLLTHRGQTFQPQHPRLVSPPAPPLPPSLPRHPSVQTHASSLQLIHFFPHLQPRPLSIQRVTFTSSLAPTARHHAVEIPNQERWTAGKKGQNKTNFVFFWEHFLKCI